MHDLPAVLGGRPVFSGLVPLVQPTLPRFAGALADDVAELFTTGMLTKGRHLAAFEEQLADYLGVGHAVAVSSCTLGLALVYRALGFRGEVIVPSFTFMATVHPLPWLGVQPVFADIDAAAWNLDPASVEAAITPHTSAIVAVHNFGNPAAIDALEALAERHRVALVFDAAHGFGACYRGRPVGSHGDAEVFSMSPTKLLVAGEGGVVATNRDDVAAFVRTGREYGNAGDYSSDFPGLNARLAEFNAIVGLRSLAMLEANAERRNEVVALFRRQLARVPGLAFQWVHPDDRCSYKDLSVVVDPDAFGLSRDELGVVLRAEGADTRRYHYPPVHTHPTYRRAGTHWHLPVTDLVAARSLSLPVWSHMDDATVHGICDAIERAHRYSAEIRTRLRAKQAEAIVADGREVR